MKYKNTHAGLSFIAEITWKHNKNQQSLSIKQILISPVPNRKSDSYPIPTPHLLRKTYLKIC